MIQHVKCAQCDAELIHDDGLEQNDKKQETHPDATRYWKYENSSKSIVEYYCSAVCGLARHEINEKE